MQEAGKKEEKLGYHNKKFKWDRKVQKSRPVLLYCTLPYNELNFELPSNEACCSLRTCMQQLSRTHKTFQGTLPAGARLIHCMI